MREIKFRAWNEKESNPNARMIHPATLMHDGKVIMPDGEEWEIPVMQFTGLLDKNGKEIYESDILETGTGHHLKVEWNESCAMWTLDGLQGFMMKLPDGAIVPMNQYSEVISNIYENPELINPTSE